MRSVIRSIKNEIMEYTEGERLVREMTSNDDIPPSSFNLKRLAKIVNNSPDYPLVFQMLYKRLLDIKYIRHIEKALIVVEYLLKNADGRFVRHSKMQLKHFNMLTRYKYILDGRDVGGHVRRRARRVVKYLTDDAVLEEARGNAQGTKKKPVKVAPKKRSAQPKKVEPKREKPKPKPKPKPKAKAKPKSKPVAQEPAKPAAPKEQAAPEEDLFDFMDNNPKPAKAGDLNEDWLSDFSANPMGAQTGMGDDGGQFGFADVNEEFDMDDDPFAPMGDTDDMFNDDNNTDEAKDESADWMGLTNLDNPLEAPSQPQKPLKGKGKSMAQLASTQDAAIPHTFDSNFVSSIASALDTTQQPHQPPPRQQQQSSFPASNAADPFANYQPQPAGPNLFGPSQGGGGSAFGGSNDPFASFAAPTQQQQSRGVGGPVPATIPSRHEPKDPFADFGLGGLKK